MDVPKVLIVDDDPIIRTLLRHALSGETYQLLEATNGRQALEVADSERPDLILLDVMMPELNGIEVLRRLKAREHTGHIPVIIITALSGEADVATSLDEGAIDHITKPFSELIVKTRVRAALRNRVAPPHIGEAPEPKRGRCIGFLGAKGGVGVTTAAVNTAVAMAAPQRSVALVELRYWPGTAAMQLGLTAGGNLDKVLTQPLGSRLNSEMITPHLRVHRSGVKLLAAPPALAPDCAPASRHHPRDLLQVLAGVFDFVIVDLPSAESTLAMGILNACDFIVLTVELESTCIVLSRLVYDSVTSGRLHADSTGALLILHDLSAGTLVPVGHARDQLPCPVIGVVPPCGGENLHALKTGVPVIHSAPTSAAAVAYSELGARLMAERISALTF